MKQKRGEVHQKLARIMNKNAQKYYDEQSANFRIDNPQENELYNLMKHNNEGTFIISVINSDEPMQKVMKWKVPFSNVKVINSKNEEEPVDIICEEEGRCVLYLVAKLDGWSETFFKLVPSSHKQEIYPINKAGKIGFWTQSGSFELAMEEEIIRYKHCKSNNNNYNTNGQNLIESQLNFKSNNQGFDEIIEGLSGQVQDELEQNGVNLEVETKQQIVQGVYDNVVKRMKEQGLKIKEQAEKSLQQKSDLGERIEERLSRFVQVAIQSEVERDLEARSLIKAKHNLQGLKQSIAETITQFLANSEFSGQLSEDEKEILQMQILNEMLNKIDLQQWIMTEKIIDKMEARTGEKIDHNQRKQIGQEVRKELLTSAINKGIKDINEKIQIKLNKYLQEKQQANQKQQNQEQQQKEEQQNKDESKYQEPKNEEQFKLKKGKILQLKNELVLLKEKKQKLMINGELVSDKLVEQIIEKEEGIQQLSQSIRAIESKVEKKQTNHINKKHKKSIKKEQKLKDSQVLVKNVDAEQELKEEEIEQKEVEINQLKSKLSQTEEQYENQVKTVEELKEEINKEKKRLVDEERQLKQIQVGKLDEKMEEEKARKGALLKRISELRNLKAKMMEVQEKEQQVQQAVSVFAQYLHSQRSESESDLAEESKNASEVLSGVMKNMEQEEEAMLKDQQSLMEVEKQIEEEREKLAGMIREKEMNLVQIQTQRDKLQENIRSLPEGNFHSFLEMQSIVDDQYVCLQESFIIKFMQYTCQHSESCSDQTYFRPQANSTELFQNKPDITFIKARQWRRLLFSTRVLKTFSLFIRIQCTQSLLKSRVQLKVFVLKMRQQGLRKLFWKSLPMKLIMIINLLPILMDTFQINILQILNLFQKIIIQLL
eukprot:TRINITY_DN986_c0_g1_i8.p1 TRINITY_DN986_c0_g1~~TRINITY_DN986_c0_g1_i8.p1  ORF type:complete len:885 (-),score=169.17 TRINITY_DN986_c0_g1_i8:647-3301(-)